MDGCVCGGGGGEGGLVISFVFSTSVVCRPMTPLLSLPCFLSTALSISVVYVVVYLLVCFFAFLLLFFFFHSWFRVFFRLFGGRFCLFVFLFDFVWLLSSFFIFILKGCSCDFCLFCFFSGGGGGGGEGGARKEFGLSLVFSASVA